MEIVFLTLIAFIVGSFSSMLGVGGGFIYVPFLHLMLSLPLGLAVGSSKVAVMFTALSASLSYLRKGLVKLKVCALMLSASIPGTILGVYLIDFIDPKPVKVIFSIVAIYASIQMMGLGRRVFKVKASRKLPLSLPFSFAAGLIAGLTGIGGGFLFTPILNLVVGLSMHFSVASSMFLIFFTSLAASINHFRLGHVHLFYAAPLVAGVLFGGFMGAKIVVKVEERKLKQAFSFVLLFVSLLMLLSSLDLVLMLP